MTRRVDARSVGSRSISKSIDRTIDRSKSIDRTRSIDRYFDSMIRMFDCSNVRHFDDCFYKSNVEATAVAKSNVEATAVAKSTSITRWRSISPRRGVSSRRLVEASQVEEDQRGGHDGHADEDVRGDVLVVWVVLERGRDEFLDGDENHHPRDEAEEGTERGGGHVVAV